MQSTLLLIDLVGAAALLLWGLRLLKAGVNSAFGARLRQFVAASTRNRLAAFGGGLVATLALQSSTAMAVIVGSFAAQGFVTAAMAQAVMLGANLGTAVVAEILALDLHWLAPVAIVTGVIASSRKSRRSRSVGEIALGIGLMLLSLGLMAQATEPLRASPALADFLKLLGNAPVVAVGLSAALAALMASSLAVVLFIMALATAGGVDPTLCLLLVAGANLGGALPPLLVAAGEGVVARRVTISNLLVRGTGTLAVLILAPIIGMKLPADIDVAQLTIHAHLAFNATLAVSFLPLVGPLAHLLQRVLPDKRPASESGPRHLDETAIADPPSALASAMRETLRVGDLVEGMLNTSLIALRTNDEQLCESVFQLDDQVDVVQEAIKLYLARVDRDGMDDAARRQLVGILDYAMNLEHVGDIIERSLTRLTLKKIQRHVQYSPEGLREIEDLFDVTTQNLRLAQSVFLNRDAQMARRLMERKVEIRRKERASIEQHMARLHERRTDTLQTTSLHMDVLRDLKRINGHLISVAAPILEEAGFLRESRVREGAKPRKG